MSFAILADAVTFIAKHVREDNYDALFEVCLDRPDKDSFIHCVKLLKEIDKKTPLPFLYAKASFPPKANKFKLGGHGSELGHIHIDFIKKKGKWFLDKIWLCK
jgi:hypothetical protein